jgi:predicted RND superfamily exporter protein
MLALLRRLVVRTVDFGGRHPVKVLFAAFVTIVATWSYSYCFLRDHLNTNLLELLPRDSAGFRAFEHQLGRVGGGADLIVVVESPDRAANERFVDALSAKLDADVAERKTCLERCGADGACAAACPEGLVAYVENGTKDVQRFFREHRWLYAELADLEDADRRVDHEVATRLGIVDDFDEPAPAPAEPGAPPPSSPGAQPAPLPKDSLGLEAYRQKWDWLSRHDDFPTGYFATPDGRMMAVRIVSNTRGMGDPASDRLQERVRQMVREIDPPSLHPEMQVGLAGNIANAVQEKDSLLTEAGVAGGVAFVLIFAGVVAFFRSPWAAIIIVVPPLIGVGFAYTFASFAYGYVNSTGAFLGAIILGNGINYPIVLLHRYREFRARGMVPEVARREAVLNAFRAELVGSLVASIAYGSLVVTRFRGFNQFGVIGFVGMLLVWLSMIPCVPALLTVDEWIQARAPRWLRDAPVAKEHARRGPIMDAIATATEKAPWLFLAGAVVATIWACRGVPAYLRDPWEYDFDKLGSRGSHVSGAMAWSVKSDQVFGGKQNIAGALMLADTPEQVPALKKAILDADAADPEGRLIANVATVWDFLPGSPEEQAKKLEVLARIRSHLTPRVLAELDPEERARVDELTPPETLAVLGPKDLPPLIRRRFEENDGRVGTVLYVQPRNEIRLSDGRIAMRLAKATSNVRLPDDTVVPTANFWTIYGEIIHSMERDGPIASLASFCAVLVVVVIATGSTRGAVTVMGSLLLGVLWTLGGASREGLHLNFANFIALPITFGIGSEYPFNVFDRSRLLGGDVSSAVRLSGGAVSLCSYTTVIGYGSLLFADNQALQSFGRLAMGGEIACLVAALVVLPSLLHVWKARDPASRRRPS